jgi:hypothetical protein
MGHHQKGHSVLSFTILSLLLGYQLSSRKFMAILPFFQEIPLDFFCIFITLEIGLEIIDILLSNIVPCGESHPVWTH